MFDPMHFLAEERGALDANRVSLIAAVLLLLGMAAYELFDAGLDSLVSTVDPGVAAFTAELELAAGPAAD